MKRTKTQKGITLVALIITIVVLLILAVVAITAIQSDGILGHVNNAANQYTSNQLAENSLLNDYENLLNSYNDEDLKFMKRYVIGNGEKLLEDIIDPSTYTFLDDETTPDIDESIIVTFLNLAEDSMSNKRTHICKIQ